VPVGEQNNNTYNTPTSDSNGWPRPGNYPGEGFQPAACPSKEGPGSAFLHKNLTVFHSTASKNGKCILKIAAVEADEGNAIPIATPLEEQSSSGPNGPSRGYAAGQRICSSEVYFAREVKNKITLLRHLWVFFLGTGEIS
jgi:hypothetical protein